MAKVLIPVDGSDPALRAVRWVIEQIRSGSPHSVTLLNVQPDILAGRARAYFSRADLDAYMNEQATEQLADAQGLFAEAGIACESSFVLGHAPTVIAEFAQQGNFEQIVMGTRGLNRISGLLLGSAATGVLHLVDIPVTLIK